MDLIDIIEMISDWKASTLRYKEGCHRADTLEDIYKHLSLNVPKIRKRDLKFLKDTLLKGVIRLDLDGFLKYSIVSTDYGDLSAYS